MTCVSGSGVLCPNMSSAAGLLPGVMIFRNWFAAAGSGAVDALGAEVG